MVIPDLGRDTRDLARCVCHRVFVLPTHRPSSAKTTDEIPYYWKVFQYVPVYKFLPAWIIKKPVHMRNYFLGATSHMTKDYVRHVTLNADEDFYKWAIGAIVSWENKTVPENIVHIHGINDKLLPYKFVKPDISIANGGHLMIMENATEISDLLKQVYLN